VCFAGICDAVATEICDNLYDDNGNTLIDCADPECEGFVFVPIACGVGVCTACGQLICSGFSQVDMCSPGSPTEEPEATCNDGLDNDCDGLTDAADVDDCAVTLPYPAPVPKTGQITSLATGDDGDLKKGVAWPNPRFTDNGNGTVTDNLTGLIWLKNADCYQLRTWAQALTVCHGLNSGECGLSDGSVEGDWRLPNLFELESLRDMAYYDPALSNTAGTDKWTWEDPFTLVRLGYYWSSTAYAYSPDNAWCVLLSDGYVNIGDKSISYYVWPVRGGH
jgi:hypothetical protein